MKIVKNVQDDGVRCPKTNRVHFIITLEGKEVRLTTEELELGDIWDFYLRVDLKQLIIKTVADYFSVY